MSTTLARFKLLPSHIQIGDQFTNIKIYLTCYKIFKLCMKKYFVVDLYVPTSDHFHQVVMKMEIKRKMKISERRSLAQILGESVSTKSPKNYYFLVSLSSICFYVFLKICFLLRYHEVRFISNHRVFSFIMSIYL